MRPYWTCRLKESCTFCPPYLEYLKTHLSGAQVLLVDLWEVLTHAYRLFQKFIMIWVPGVEFLLSYGSLFK